MKTPITLLPVLLLTGCYTQLQVAEPYTPPTRTVIYREVPATQDTQVVYDEEEAALYEEESRTEVIHVRDRSRALWSDRSYRAGFADGYWSGYDDGFYDNYRRDRWYWSFHYGWGFSPFYVYHPYYYGYYGHPHWRFRHHHLGWVTYNYYVIHPNQPNPVTRSVNQGRRASGYQATSGSGNVRPRTSGTVQRDVRGTTRGRTSGSDAVTQGSRPASRPSGSSGTVERRGDGGNSSGSSSGSRPAGSGTGGVQRSSGGGSSSGSGSSRPARRD